MVLYVIYYTVTHFRASVVQWKETFFRSIHKMMETGEFFVVYRECDEGRSSEAAMGEGRGGGEARSAPALQVSEFKKTGARSARARTRGQNPLVYHIFI